MNVSEQVINVMQELSQQLGVAVEKLYPMLVKQAYIDGVKSLLGGVTTLVLIVICVKLMRKLIKEPMLDEWGEWSLPLLLGVSSLGICVVILTIMCYANFSSSITPLLNPDWYITKNLITKLIK